MAVEFNCGTALGNFRASGERQQPHKELPPAEPADGGHPGDSRRDEHLQVGGERDEDAARQERRSVARAEGRNCPKRRGFRQKLFQAQDGE